MPSTRRLAVGLARAGVTATVTTATGNRYGALDTDTNLPETEIVAIADPDAAGLADARKAAGNPPGFADYREMLVQLRPEILP